MDLVGILFSLALFASGAYISFRGWERRKANSMAQSRSGSISSERPVAGILSKQKCAYLRLTVDVRKRNQWAQIIEVERRPPFLLEGMAFDPKGSDIDAPEAESIGFLYKEEGALDVFLATSSSKKFIDAETTKRLLSLPEAKSKLAPHVNDMLHIREACIPDGSAVFVLADIPAAAGGRIYPLLVSSSGESEARSSLEKTAVKSFMLGGALILISALVLLLSLLL